MKRPNTEIELGMSNADGIIDAGLADALKNGTVYAQHSAYNFCGFVYWDGVQYIEDIWQHNGKIKTIEADTLKALMELANDEYGYE